MTIINLNFQIPETYHNLVKAFNFSEVNKLPPHYKNNLEINLKPGIKSFFKFLY